MDFIIAVKTLQDEMQDEKRIIAFYLKDLADKETKAELHLVYFAGRKADNAGFFKATVFYGKLSVSDFRQQLGEYLALIKSGAIKSYFEASQSDSKATGLSLLIVEEMLLQLDSKRMSLKFKNMKIAYLELALTVFARQKEVNLSRLRDLDKGEPDQVINLFAKATELLTLFKPSK